MGLPDNLKNLNVGSVLILCRNQSKMARVADHLNKSGYPTKITDTIKNAVALILKEKPNYVLVSWNINNVPKKVVRSLNQTFNITCIPFAEWPDRDTSNTLSRSGIKDIILYPISGVGVARLLERLEGQRNRKHEETKSLSKIQIKSSPDDVPRDGEWIALPGQKNSWFLQTDSKPKGFGKKNGRFIFHGDKAPDRLPNGRWKFDLIKGKLDFEIINVLSTKQQNELKETQSSLTEDEAIRRLSKSIGRSVEELDIEAELSFGEEEIFQNEITMDKNDPHPPPEFDNLLETIAKNLEEGFLDAVEKEVNQEELGAIKSSSGSDTRGDLIYTERDENGRGATLIKVEKKSKSPTLIDGDERHDGITHVKSDSTNKGPTHIKGELRQRGPAHLGGEEQEQSAPVIIDTEKSARGELIFQDRKKETEYKATQGSVEEAERNYGNGLRGFGKQGLINEDYQPRIEGIKTNFAKSLHETHLGYSDKPEGRPQIVGLVKKLVMITFSNNVNRGYVLIASTNDTLTNVTGLKKITEPLSKKLLGPDGSKCESAMMELEVAEVNFAGWAKENAQFTSFVQDGAIEIAIAYIPSGREVPELAAAEASHMAAIDRTTILPDQKISFDLYLFLEKNQKFILYIKRADTVVARQLNNLVKKSMGHFYIRLEHVMEYKLYCAKHFIITKIESARKYIKVG